MHLSYAVCSSRGKVRSINQDNYYLNGYIKEIDIQDREEAGDSSECSQIFAVCDGMGGEEYGELAAWTAVNDLLPYKKEKRLSDWNSYLRRANSDVCRLEYEKVSLMGTTFAGIKLDQAGYNNIHIYTSNVGDSRIYRIRDAEMIQLSEDHTEFQNLVNQGRLKKEDFKESKSHNILLQHLGIPEREMVLSPTEYKDQAEPGDYYLLCTDGLYGVLSDEEIVRIIRHVGEPDLVCSELVKQALDAGSRDNVTAMVILIRKENFLQRVIGSVFS